MALDSPRAMSETARMTLDLGIDFDKILGSRPPPSEVVVVREAAMSDYECAGQASSATDFQPRKLTERHHALARALAMGLKDHEAANRVGYDKQMLVILKRSPAFLDLVEVYRSEVNLAFVDHAEQLAGLATDAILAIRDRLEEDPEAFGTRMLLEIATTVGDRAGYGPIKRTENVNVNVSLGEKLALARARVAQMKDITPNAE